MVTRRLIKRSAVRPPPRPHRSRAMPSGLVSGIIYSLAAMVAIGLGFVFYRNVQRARYGTVTVTAPDENLSSDLPPNVKIVGQRDMERHVAPLPAAPQQPTKVQRVATQSPISPPMVATTATASADSAESSTQPSDESRPGLPRPVLLPRPSWKPTLESLVHTEKVRLKPIADTVILSAQKGGENINGGAATRLPIRGNEAFLLVRYDTTPIRGWTILRATWSAKIPRGALGRFGFSAVTAPWQEGSGTLEHRASNGATFAWTDFGKARWRHDGLPFSYVIRGNAETWFSLGELVTTTPDAGDATTTDEWVHLSIDPVLVQAMVAGTAQGLAISDELGQLGDTWWVPSRETDSDGHYLTVEGARADILPPSHVKSLRAVEHAALKRGATTGVILQWVAGGDDFDRGQGFLYDIRYGSLPCTYDTARPISSDKRPRPQRAGQNDQVVIEGLLPGTTYTFFVRLFDEIGQAGPVAELTYQTEAAQPFSSVPPPAMFAADSVKLLKGTVAFQALDGLQLLSPVARTEKDAEPTLIWDRNARTIRLRCARNETASLVLQLSRVSTGDFPVIRFTLEPWQHPKYQLAASATFYRVWFSRTEGAGRRPEWCGDALLPITNNVLNVRQPEHRILNASRHFVLSDLHVPTSAEPGIYVSRLVLTDVAASLTDTVNIVLEVLPIRLPEEAAFTVELGAAPVWSSIYKKGSDRLTEIMSLEQAYSRLAREHGCILALIGADAKGWAPTVSGRGADLQVTSWREWDAHVEALCSDLKTVAAGLVPANHIILPFSENWPVPWHEGFRCSDKLVRNRSGCQVYVGSDQEIADCMGRDYWMAWRRALQEFRAHSVRVLPQMTTCHVWLRGNAGGGEQQPPWNLGEPRFRSDFMALEVFSRLVHAEARNGTGAHPLFMRATVPDTSLLPLVSPQAFHLLCITDMSPAAWELCRIRARETGETLWYRSAAPSPDAMPVETEAVILRTFLWGAHGWSVEEAIGRPEDWARAAARSLLYCGAPFGQAEPFPSVRLKAIYRALQDLAYLRLLAEKMGWSAERTGEFVRRELPALADPIGRVTAMEIATLRAKVQVLLLQ